MDQIDLTGELRRLYTEQLRLRHEQYLYLQSRSAGGIRRRIEIFERYQSYVQGPKILDWGCKHAVDSCLIRKTLGPGVELEGCDFGRNDFEIFHSYAGLKFVELSHPHLLPYGDNEFDTVICSGVLEHVPNDSSSLIELYRILRPGGRLIITFLPNRFSYTERLVGWMGGPNHQRTYSLSEARRMLLHHGFRPLLASYHQMVPSFSSPGSQAAGENSVLKGAVEVLFRANSILERIWLIRGVASNLFLISEKVRHF